MISEALKSTASKLAGFGVNMLRASFGLGSPKSKPVKDKGTDVGEISSEHLEMANDVLGMIYRELVRAREDEKLTEELNKTTQKSRDIEEQKRHEEIIKALTVKRKPTKKKEPPPKKEEPTTKEKPKETPKETPKKVEKVPSKEAPSKPTAKAEPKPSTTTPKAEKVPTPSGKAPIPGKGVETAVKSGAGVISTITGALVASGITNAYAQKAILANVGKETGFKPRTENLKAYSNTSNERIRKIFTSRVDKYSDAELNEIKKDEYKFGEVVYGKDTKIGQSMGNTEEGDGYKYRGRGSIQLTGKNNYKAYSKVVGADLVKNPDLVNDPQIDARIVAEFVKKGTGGKLDFKSQEEANRAVTQAIGGSRLNLDAGVGAEFLSKVEEYSVALGGVPPSESSSQTSGSRIEVASKENKELKDTTQTKQVASVNNTTIINKSGESKVETADAPVKDRPLYQVKARA